MWHYFIFTRKTFSSRENKTNYMWKCGIDLIWIHVATCKKTKQNTNEPFWITCKNVNLNKFHIQNPYYLFIYFSLSSPVKFTCDSVIFRLHLLMHQVSWDLAVSFLVHMKHRPWSWWIQSFVMMKIMSRFGSGFSLICLLNNNRALRNPPWGREQSLRRSFPLNFLV